jgi:hypothetical protein
MRPRGAAPRLELRSPQPPMPVRVTNPSASTIWWSSSRSWRPTRSSTSASRREGSSIGLIVPYCERSWPVAHTEICVRALLLRDTGDA